MTADLGGHGSAPFVPRRHPIEGLIRSNARAAELVHSTVHNYAQHAATADRATKLLEQLSTASLGHPQSDRPQNLDTLDEWVDNEVARRIGARDLEVRTQVLRELSFHARTEAQSLLDESVDDLLSGLELQLAQFVGAMTDAVAELGDSVSTAAEAIDAGRSAQWKTLSDGLPAYRDIRHVQIELYRGAGWPFDREACGDSNKVTDPEARLYFHRRLPDIAPQWMADPTVRDGFGQTIADPSMPWPADPVERLAWCIRNDTGIWCPTTQEISAATSAPVPPRNPRPDEPKFQGIARGKPERELLHPSVVSALSRTARR